MKTMTAGNEDIVVIAAGSVVAISNNSGLGFSGTISISGAINFLE